MADIHIFPDAPEGTPKANFVHLHVHSDYSLLDSCAKIDDLIAKAKMLNMPALALTDHGNMFGALNFEHICHANGINPIVGEEFYVAYGSHLEKNSVPYSRKGEDGDRQARYFHLILLCENETGYKNMCWLSSIAYTEGTWYKPRIDFELLEKYHEGLICCSACVAGELPQLLLAGKDDDARELVLKYKNLFGPDHYYIELQDHGLPEQKELNPKLIALARELDVPLVVTNDIHYIEKEDWEAQDCLRCIGFKKVMTEPHQQMGGDLHEWYFKTEEEMRALFPDCPDAYENTIKIANMCNLTIHQYKTQELKGTLPRFDLPKEFQVHSDYTKNQDDYMRNLVEKGLRKRYKEITPEIRQRCEYEMGIILKMGFSGYFLIVWEFINWSKSTYDNLNKRPKPYMPIGPGRGSGAGSLVAYCLEITDIDPFRYKLIFERFLNPERVSMPDFDIDMDFDFRQDIIQHTRDLYGSEKVGHIVTFGTLKPKNCIADVGRTLGIPLSEVAMLKSKVSENLKAKLKNCFEPANEKFPDGGQLAEFRHDPRYEKLFDLAIKLEGCKRNTGLHASGMVIGLTELPNWAPVFKDTKEGKVGVQYTMDIIEPCGLVKFDYLGLKTLSLIRYAETIVNKHKKPDEPLLDCSKVSETDKKTFELFKRGDSVAVFQFESPGMQKILRQFQPEKLEDLVALNALYRPGPMDYIPNYIDGKWKPETVHYPDPCLKGILEETYGVMVYQEQVMQVSQKIAGFSLGGADMLRRAMGKKKPEVLMGKKKEFVEGALKQGFTKEHAEEIFEIMIPFAGYGFNKSHAAAYSVLAYRTGWLKANKPAEFMAANLTNEINSADKLPEYIEESKKRGIPVDPPDVNRSDVIFDVVDGHIVFGLKGIKGMGESVSKAIVSERERNGPFKSFMDFVERMVQCTDDTGKLYLNKKALEVLIKCGGFDNLDKNRPTLIANYEEAFSYAEKKFKDSNSSQLSLFGDSGISEYEEFKFKEVEDCSMLEKLNMEKELVGCYVSGHPLDDYKSAYEKASVNSSTILRAAKQDKAERELYFQANKRRVPRDFGKVYTVVGMIINIREYTTKTGEKMGFGTLQDYDGTVDLTFFKNEWAEIKDKIVMNGIYAFSGKVDGTRDTPSFIVNKIEDPELLKEKAYTEIHIQLESGFKSEDDVSRLREFLLKGEGRCSLFFHVDTETASYIIRANQQLTANPTKDFLDDVKSFPFIKDAWAS